MAKDGEESQLVTVKVGRELHREASIVAVVEGRSFKEIVEAGLRKEIGHRLDNNERLRHAVHALRGVTA